MKKMIILLLGAIMLTVPVAAEAQEAKKHYLTITKTPTGDLNVRKEPNGEVIAKVKPGERYQRINPKKVKGWYQILLNDGRSGWIASKYGKLERGQPGKPTKGNDFKINSDGVITGGGPSVEPVPPPPPPPALAPAEQRAETTQLASIPAAAAVPSTDGVRIKLQRASLEFGRRGFESEAEEYTLGNDLNASALIRFLKPGWSVEPCLRLEARRDPYDFSNAGLDTDLRYPHWYGQGIGCLGYQTSTYETYIEGGVGVEVPQGKDLKPVGWIQFESKLDENWSNRFSVLSLGKTRTEVTERIARKYNESWTFGAQYKTRVHGTGDQRRYLWDIGPVVNYQYSPQINAEIRVTYSPFTGYGAAAGVSFTTP